MKVKQLINKLSKLPQNLEVCIIDLHMNEKYSSDVPTPDGIHRDFDVEVVLTKEELKELRKEMPEAKNWVALSFWKDEEEDTNS